MQVRNSGAKIHSNMASPKVKPYRKFDIIMHFERLSNMMKHVD